MGVFRSVVLFGLGAAILGLGGLAAYNAYRNSQPPSFSAERFVRLCRPQLEAGAKAMKLAQEATVAQATGTYLRAKIPEAKRGAKAKMDEAQAALDDMRANGIYAKAAFLSLNADWFGRMDDAGVVRTTIEQFTNNPDEAAAICMLNGKLAQVEGRPVGDEYLDAPSETVPLPLKQSEIRVAFQNGCGAVMASTASKNALADTEWMGACSFGLAHGKGLRLWNGTLTPTTYFYGFDITKGQPGVDNDSAPGQVSEIAARFKPLEASRLQKLRTMLAARASALQGRGR